MADFGRGGEAIVSEKLKLIPFRLLIDIDALDLLNDLPVRRRRRVFEHLQNIQNFPGSYSVDIYQDRHGRRLDVSIFDGLSILYWTDMADRHVKILHILRNE